MSKRFFFPTSTPSRSWLLVALLSAILPFSFFSSTAAASQIEYRGYALSTPPSWPVYYLDQNPGQCVSFNVHAVFLGAPGSNQNCPAHVAGRSAAVLVQPLTSVTPIQMQGASKVVPGQLLPALPPTSQREVSFALPAAGIFVTATWNSDSALVWNVLRTAHLTASAHPASPPAASSAAATPRSAPASPASSFTGLGFDACTAPSSSNMSSWHISSPYLAVGVYIGGLNRGCSQPNLTPSWVNAQVASGWRIIPIYVGVQAPNNSCGCASISQNPVGDGFSAADDAVARANSLNMPSGNIIYYDMEGYAPGGSNTSSVLSFLSAWTSRLHDHGYLSGVYSSAASGMKDLVSQYGTSYIEPDDIWIAHWNGQQTTDDSYVPSEDWANHQRLHQYHGGQVETYGGVSMNVDGNYLDGVTFPSGNPQPAVAGVTMDGYGGVHHFGSVQSNTWGSATWPKWVIARSVAVLPDHSGGYTLDGFGGIHPFGSAPPLTSNAYWRGWDIARKIVLTSDGLGGYILDGFGGVHPFGNAPNVNITGYWNGWDIATAIVLRSDNKSGYVMDGWGGLHPFAASGVAMPNNITRPYWRGWNIARDIALTSDGGGYLLDGFGGVHDFGAASPIQSNAYWPNWDVARGISFYSFNPVSGYLLDAFGGLHPIGAAQNVAAPVYLNGQYVFRGVAVTP